MHFIILRCGFQGGHTGPPLQAMMAKNTSTELQKNQKKVRKLLAALPDFMVKKAALMM